jgi:predicted component of type VI protein secretion system
MAFVTIRIKGAEGYTRTALGKERMVLGRSSENDLPIKHTSISREHCAFVREGDDWFVEDLGSSNGTIVNKDKLTGRVKLNEKDVVKAGKARLTFHLGDINAAEAAVELHTGDDEDDDAPAGAAGSGNPDDPAQAMRCPGCGTWLSVAHRMAGDAMTCPRCGHGNKVPAA